MNRDIHDHDRSSVHPLKVFLRPIKAWSEGDAARGEWLVRHPKALFGLITVIVGSCYFIILYGALKLSITVSLVAASTIAMVTSCNIVRNRSKSGG